MEKKKNRLPFYLAIASHFEGEGGFPPSMVEPSNNLSLEQIVRDYTRGIVHPTLPAMYDEGDEIPEDMNEISDFTDLPEANPRTPARPDSKPVRAPEDGHSATVGKPVTKNEEEEVR